MLKPLSSSVPFWLSNVYFLHQNSPSRSGTCLTQLLPLWVALDETLRHQVWFPPILLGGTSRFSVRQYQESESQIHESCCLLCFFFYKQLCGHRHSWRSCMRNHQRVFVAPCSSPRGRSVAQSATRCFVACIGGFFSPLNKDLSWRLAD